MKLVYIEWEDACSNPKWFDLHNAMLWHDDKRKHVIREVGWIIKEDKRGITLAMRWNPENDNSDDQFGSLQYIPKPWIIKRKTIKAV